jgi:hypothetical protein
MREPVVMATATIARSASLRKHDLREACAARGTICRRSRADSRGSGPARRRSRRRRNGARYFDLTYRRWTARSISGIVIAVTVGARARSGAVVECG